MFTVKTKIDSSTILYETERVIIAWKGSAGYDDAMQLKGTATFPVASIINKQDEFADEEMTEIVSDGYNIVVQRNDNPTNDPIAVIIGLKADSEDSVMSSGECVYTFIYSCDEVYVTDSSGKTVESIR